MPGWPGKAVGPRRVAQANSAATRSAISSRSNTGPASSQPMASANLFGQSGRRGSETRSGDGSAGTTTPCCTLHRRARMVAARGFSSAGMNRPNRPAFTPIAFSPARAGGGSASPSSPRMRPSASVSRCSRPRKPGWAFPLLAAASSGARSWPILSSRKRCSLIRSRSRCAPSRNSLSSICTRGRRALLPRFRRPIGTPSQMIELIVAEGEGAVGGRFRHRDAARHLLSERPACSAQHEALLVALVPRGQDRS